MNSNMKEVCQSIELMEKYLREKLREKQLWENTYICKQIEKRNNGGTFTISDHIQAMVYSMLSSGAPWERLEKDIDPITGGIPTIDKIFCQYDYKALLKADTDKLYNSVKALHYTSQYTRQQIKALIEVNIKIFQRLENQYESIDNFYRNFIEIDGSLKTLVLVLSAQNSPFKMSQMGEALTAEYLRNVGYDLAKPDRHIRRILGSKILGCSDKETVPIYETFDIVADIAVKMNKPTAEVDYILWSYCASGFGEICLKAAPKCELCVAKSHCISNNRN
ncbi:MAG: hypothetical protein K2N38_04170 [Oscillospiraceae bacterium]|nr:hypothetical protein [Oscillospiraceae bacterium]